MADVTNELILEHLKRIHAKLLDHDGRFDVIDRRLGHLEMSFAGMQQQLGQLAETDAHLQVQIVQLRRNDDRINQRLDLGDPIL